MIILNIELNYARLMAASEMDPASCGASMACGRSTSGRWQPRRWTPHHAVHPSPGATPLAIANIATASEEEA
jgi:hypothetical protein